MTEQEFLDLAAFQASELNAGVKRFGLPWVNTLLEKSALLSLYPIKYLEGSFCLDQERFDECFEYCKDRELDIIQA